MGIFDVLPRTAETRDGRLTIGGVVPADAAAESGTPASVVGLHVHIGSPLLDEDRRPPVVLCTNGEATLAVRRETFNDLLARNVP